MSNIISRIGNLITVKSIVTIILTVVFAIVTLKGQVSTEAFITVFSMIVGYYFGTQKLDDTEKKDNKENKGLVTTE